MTVAAALVPLFCLVLGSVTAGRFIRSWRWRKEAERHLMEIDLAVLDALDSTIVCAHMAIERIQQSQTCTEVERQVKWWFGHIRAAREKLPLLKAEAHADTVIIEEIDRILPFIEATDSIKLTGEPSQLINDLRNQHYRMSELRKLIIAGRSPAEMAKRVIRMRHRQTSLVEPAKSQAAIRQREPTRGRMSQR